MAYLLLSALLLLFLTVGNPSVLSQVTEEFLKQCPQTRCGSKSPEIRFPLRLESSPESCGIKNTSLSCSGDHTILTLPSGDYEVTAIDYVYRTMTVRKSSNSSCPLKDLVSLRVPDDSIYMTESTYYEEGHSVLLGALNCSRSLRVEDYRGAVAGPISCFGEENGLVYAVDLSFPIENLPSGACRNISTSSMSLKLEWTQEYVHNSLESFLQQPEFVLRWHGAYRGTRWYRCSLCESYGWRCGFNLRANSAMCITDFHAATTSEAGSNFFNECPPKRCSKNGPEIRFPLRLESSPGRCGLTNTGLSCAGNQTILTVPSGKFEVTAIDYTESYLTITNNSWNSSCPLRELTSIQIPVESIYKPDSLLYILNCSESLAVEEYGGAVAGPFSCFTSQPGIFYVVNSSLALDELPGGVCFMISEAPLSFLKNSFDIRVKIAYFARQREFDLYWHAPDDYMCRSCEISRGRCGFNLLASKAICIRDHHHSSHVLLVTGLSVGVLVALVTTAFLYYIYASRKYGKEIETRLRVEKFLSTYKAAKPTRYTYKELKRITKRFKHRIGQGGFGSVYKGELLNGIPVAVKVLEHSSRDGEEFTNEVATIGKIHHSNIVRLLGFCSEGSRRALVYEFLPNESLEKFIFWKEVVDSHQPFTTEQLLDIAIGIAYGIEYLHQGCDQRILHFDIKPHNILLDHNHKPKISDFGLAKLCSRDYSIVTITAARGTMGYIAPEIYSRNFGTVSYKSDVYSFGILLLEMISGKRNMDPRTASQNEVYFPDWIYDRMLEGEHLGKAMEIEGAEDILKRLVIVALWCTQWNPADRPSMTRVVHMLKGNLESLRIPPKPFVTSDHNDIAAMAV